LEDGDVVARIKSIKNSFMETMRGEAQATVSRPFTPQGRGVDLPVVGPASGFTSHSAALLRHDVLFRHPSDHHTLNHLDFFIIIQDAGCDVVPEGTIMRCVSPDSRVAGNLFPEAGPRNPYFAGLRGDGEEESAK
jgi:hypothetical protein